MDLIIGNLEEWASWISVSQFQKVQLPGRIDKIFLIVFQSLWFKKKKNDGWMTTLRCPLRSGHSCLYIRCLGILFYNLLPSSSCFLRAFHKEHSYLWPFCAEGFSCDVHGGWWVSAAVEWIPVYAGPSEGPWCLGGHGWWWSYQALSLCHCYVWGTWFDRWYVQIPVIMSHV